MKKLEAFRQELKARFLAGHTITTREFYEQQETVTLTRVYAGLDRDFDDACGGDPYRQPKEWLQDRLSLIGKILEEREAERPRTAHEKVWEAVEGRTAQKITKFNS